MKVAADFDIREFVPETLWEQFGPKCIWFINPTIITLAQFYKDYFSGYFQQEVNIIINDWLWGGRFDERGYRYPKSETGSKLSFHRGGLCSAFDCEIRIAETGEEIEPDLIREIILKNEAEFMQQGLTTLESGEYATGWIHSDCRNTGLKYILIVGDRKTASNTN